MFDQLRRLLGGGEEVDTRDWVTDEGERKIMKLMAQGRRFK